jgi:hypothetical protein
MTVSLAGAVAAERRTYPAYLLFSGALPRNHFYKVLICRNLNKSLGFLAIFGGMTVVHLGGQTDMLGAGTFWLVNVAARWFLR